MLSPFYFSAVPGIEEFPDSWHLYLVNPTNSEIHVTLLRDDTLPSDLRSPVLPFKEANTDRQSFTMPAMMSKMVDAFMQAGTPKDWVRYTLIVQSSQEERHLSTVTMPACFPALKEWYWMDNVPVFNQPGCVIRLELDRYTAADHVYTSVLSDRITAAIRFAMDAHATQKRKGDGSPYIIHPMAVHTLLASWEVPEDSQIAGILHDTIEDAPEEERPRVRARILELFGPTVLALVEHVTEQNKNLPWKERKERAIEALSAAPVQAQIVACADKTHNAFSLLEAYKKQGDNVWKSFNAPKEEIRWYYRSVATVLYQGLADRYTRELIGYVRELSEVTG